MTEFIDLNKFTKQSKIGKGAFSKVFKVIENDTKKVFAAKISRLILSEDDPTLFSETFNFEKYR